MRAWSARLVVLALALPASAAADQPMEPIPPDAAAVVGETVITVETFNRWFAVAGKGRNRRHYRAIVREVMQFLIQAEWVQGEAKLQGVRVRDRRVRRELERQKDQVFRTERAFRRWLRRAGMTEEMVLFRVRLDLLQRRLTAHVTRDIGSTRDPRVRARRQIRAIERFVADFHNRWEALTFCAPGYVVRECGAN